MLAMASLIKAAYERLVAAFLLATEHGYLPDLVLRHGIRYLLFLRAAAAVRTTRCDGNLALNNNRFPVGPGIAAMAHSTCMAPIRADAEAAAGCNHASQDGLCGRAAEDAHSHPYERSERAALRGMWCTHLRNPITPVCMQPTPCHALFFFQSSQPLHLHVVPGDGIPLSTSQLPQPCGVQTTKIWPDLTLPHRDAAAY